MGHVYYDVQMIPQGQNPICWIACVAMITSYNTKSSHPISEFTGGFDPSSSCIPNPSNGWDDFYTRLGKFGFSVDGANMSIDSDYIENLLRSYGPFIMSVNVFDFPFFGPLCVNVGKGTHSMVVNGISTPVLDKVTIMNPWGTKTPPADVDVIVKAMQGISDQGLNPVAYYAR